ncbi:MAG: LysM peptidoglycan-binding domain-containing protein, partial [Alphaproteobacteria bacterium]|nr:LysM peptidoglycan-binding domain-containing protein [Alphaproteobacteria bacterium]
KEGQQVTVMKGNALWEIARKIYGSGIAYSIIFADNKQQIRDPDMIYPGQILAIPAGKSRVGTGSPATAPQNKMP